MEAITAIQVQEIINQGSAIFEMLIVPILFVFAVYLGLYLLGLLMDTIIGFTTGASERRISQAVDGNFDGELSLSEWKEVYKRKGQAYNKMVNETMATEQDFLTKLKDD